MEAVFLRLLNMSISAGWLVLAVIVLRILLKKAPKAIRGVLWALVGIRLLCPFSFESALSLIPSAETVSPNILYSQAPTIHTGIDTLNQAANPVIAQHLAPTAGAGVNPLQVIVSAASAIWIVGVILLLSYAAVSYLRLRRRVRTAMHLRDHLWLCDNVASAFILGFFKPRVYLPSYMDEQPIDHVVAHENAHIKRHDHWWKPIGFVLLAVYWFNPLIWLSYILFCRDIEFACDEKAIKEMGTAEKKAYSNALLSCSVPHRMLSACPLAFGEVGVKGRIKNVLNYRKPTLWIIAAAVIACIAAALCFLTDPKEDALTATEPFGHSYSVVGIAYDAPQYSFAYTPDTAPQYRLTADHALMVKNSMLDERDMADWLTLGNFTQTELTKDNFDRCFEVNGGGGWQEGITAGMLRSNNEKAWRLLAADDSNSVFYNLLQQKNGDIYLTYGYYDPESETDPASDDSSIRWLFKLAVAHEAEDEVAPRPTIIMDGQAYINPYMPVDALPDGYTCAGELSEEMANDTGLNGCRYYANPERPNDLYVFQECATPISASTANPEKRQWAYVQWIAQDVPAANDADAPGQAAVSEPAQESSALDLAISTAILEHNAGGPDHSDFACESHVTLATLPGERRDEDSDAAIQTVEVYLMALYQEYRYSGSGLVNTGGSHIPCVLTFDNTQAGYVLSDYWEPRDGAYYKPDIEKRFCSLDAATVSDALDTQKFILTQTQSCYAQAVEYGKVDTTAVIDQLFEELVPLSSISSTDDLPDIIHRELTYYGDYTLKYIFSEFLKGGQTGSKGQIMSIVMNDLIGKEALKTSSVTGQEYFDAWLEYVRQIEAANGPNYMKEYAPKSWLLLQMIAQ